MFELLSNYSEIYAGYPPVLTGVYAGYPPSYTVENSKKVPCESVSLSGAPELHGTEKGGKGIIGRARQRMPQSANNLCCVVTWKPCIRGLVCLIYDRLFSPSISKPDLFVRPKLAKSANFPPAARKHFLSPSRTVCFKVRLPTHPHYSASMLAPLTLRNNHRERMVRGLVYVRVSTCACISGGGVVCPCALVLFVQLGECFVAA